MNCQTIKRFPHFALLFALSLFLLPAIAREETDSIYDDLYPGVDTVCIIPDPDLFRDENVRDLPEFVVESRGLKVLHILAYVREHSTLTSSGDSVILFREKMVDFMLPVNRKIRFKGWSTPRMLASKSYYRFANDRGLDSVSDASAHHFSWSDWIGLPPVRRLPLLLSERKFATDTVMGRFSPTVVWTRRNDNVSVEVDLLSDTIGRSWVPEIASFFHSGIEFDRFRLVCRYENVTGDSISPVDFAGCSYQIESVGRGHNLFRFNRPGEPFFVTTSADVYILDKEYITAKEATRWRDHRFGTDEVGIFVPSEAPAPEPSVLNLIARVNSIDRNQVRLDADADRRLVCIHPGDRNFNIGNRALALLKQATGITLVKSHKNFNRRWSGFREDRKTRNADSDH